MFIVSNFIGAGEGVFGPSHILSLKKARRRAARRKLALSAACGRRAMTRRTQTFSKSVGADE
jgi:hypothetical protein